MTEALITFAQQGLLAILLGSSIFTAAIAPFLGDARKGNSTKMATATSASPAKKGAQANFLGVGFFTQATFYRTYLKHGYSNG